MPAVIDVYFGERHDDQAKSAVTGTSPKYTLRFYNNSNATQTLVCFQSPETPPTNLVPAWFALKVANGVQVNFSWQQTYDLVWTETGKLAPGISFSASEVVPATFPSGNLITLTYAGGAFSFIGQTAGPALSMLQVVCDTTIPPDMVSVGIGMAGSPITLVQATPNSNYVFTPAPNYWVTLADVSQSEIFDPSNLTPMAKVTFPMGVTAMTATLTSSLTWTIQQGLVM